MGQRHQIFVKGYIGNEKHTESIHHQWMLGGLTISRLKEIIKFNKKTTRIYSFSVKGNSLIKEIFDKIVLSVYEFSAKEGYYGEHVFSLTEREKYIHNSYPEGFVNPKDQDCDDGQTFIDFTNDGKPVVGIFFPFKLTPDYTNYDYDEDDIDSKEEIHNEGMAKEPWESLTLFEYFKHYMGNIEDCKTKDDKKYYKKILKEIKYIEKHTIPMTTDHLFGMYSVLN